MDRQQLMQEIARLDKQILEVSGQKRVGRLSGAAFPMGTWISSIVLLGYYVFGGMIEQSFYPMAKWVGLILGLLLGVSALLGTFKWVVSRAKPGSSTREAAETMEKVQELRDRRAALQKQLDNI
ncbi:MAG: hypothetical protein JJU11_18045 [Candidatus Sumerlaeia bacterium]|nr:hypothetical protein [Candidatus Sumerlaeia bacterium]